MRERARLWWSGLVSTLWFVPGIMVMLSAIAGVVAVEVSALVDAEALERWPRLFGASAESSRDMLAAIAGSMITVAGVTFSLTMVAVTQASAQYTPRILRNFMRDRPSQIVLGGLTGVFTYCLVVLRTIREGDEGRFVPSIAVLGGFIFAAVGMGLLIYFVHHITSALQASSIITRVAADTATAIAELFPANAGAPGGFIATASPGPDLERMEWKPVLASRDGYVQHLDAAGLLETARKNDIVVRMDRGIGEFVVAGTPLASISGASPMDDVGREVAGAYRLAAHRTVEQDAAFGIRQLVDIAVKALSPGINDPTTAVSCVDYLGALLYQAAGRAEEPRLRMDGGALRLVARGPDFCSLVDDAFHEIRRHADGNVEVLSRIIEAIRTIGTATDDATRRARLRWHLSLLEENVGHSELPTSDSRLLSDRISQAAVSLRLGEA